jgi:hypothetical protein
VYTQRSDHSNEARKWTETLYRNLVLMNAGAAVAVLSFLGAGSRSSYSAAACALVAFAIGALLPQLSAFGNLLGANKMLGFVSDANWIGWRRYLADNSQRFLVLALVLYVVGVAIGLIALVVGATSVNRV